jgi:hypothetical protein
MTERDTILSVLADQRIELERTYRAFSQEVLTTPCTDSEDPDGAPWAPIDHLGHLLRIEKAFLGMAKLTVAGDEAPIKIAGSTWEDRIAQVHRDNEAHLDSLRPLEIETLLTELAKARTETMSFIDELSDEQLTTPIPDAPWGDGTIGGVLMANAGHERQHLAWVAEAIA